MDIERRREEAELGDKRKARLIEESEVPEFLLAQVENLFVYYWETEFFIQNYVPTYHCDRI